MKLAIMKGGTNITFSKMTKSAACADILYFLQQLGPKKHECHIISTRTRNTEIPPPLEFHELSEIQELTDYDAIILFNFSINFFGGKENLSLVHMYRLLAKTEVPIIYINTDGALPFKQLWPSIEKREWALDYCEDEFHIERNKIVYLTQGYNKTKTTRLLNSRTEFVEPAAVVHYPLETTILAGWKETSPVKPLEYRKYDLGFGGYTRNTHKRRRIEEYYRGVKFNTLLFGNLRGVDSQAKIHPRVSYQEFIPVMSNCKATIIVGDLYYNNNFFTLRMYESILAGCAVFIDSQLDGARLFYKNPLMQSFYVRAYHEVPSDLDESWHIAQSFRKELLDNYDFESSVHDLEQKLELCINATR